MKKIILYLLSVCMIFSICNFNVEALSVEYELLSQLGEIEVSDKYTFSISKLNRALGTGINLDQSNIGEDGIEFIMNIFCDENLISLEEDPISFEMDSEFTQNGIDIDFEDVNRIIWTISFTEEKVFVEKNDSWTKPSVIILSRGLYEFKDKSLYEELMKKINAWNTEQKQINDEKVEELQTNKISFTNFKFIYTGIYRDSHTEIEWGVCEYLRDGDTKPVTMIFDSYFWTDEVKILKINDSLSGENTYTSENKRLIKLEGSNPSYGIEYDFYFDGYLISEVNLKLSVDENMKAQKVVQTITKTNGDIIGPFDFDMSKYNETGSLPIELFSVDNTEKTKDEISDTDNTETKTDHITEENVEQPDEQNKSVRENETIVDDKMEANMNEEKEEEIKSDESSDAKDAFQKEDLPKNETAKEINDFIDVPLTHWAYNEIHDFAANGIVLGYGNGYFGVDDHITYEHFALLLDRLFGYVEDDTQPIPAVREDVIVSVVKALGTDISKADISIIQEKFSDCEELQEKNLTYIAEAIDMGLVIGSYGMLYPDDYLTRAETVMLLSRALSYYQK